MFVTARPGEDLTIPFGMEDVGGDLVAIASAGLYTDPRDALREFCQNAVDADASRITIRFTGLNAAVIDDGHGMGFEDLIFARRFARSQKVGTESVGFRGIGIYSAFQICQRLIVVSQQAGSDQRWTMTFDFASMHQTLKDRVDDGRGLETALGPLIQAHTTVAFDRLPIAEVPRSGSTIVLLENIDPDAYSELSEIESLKRYLRRTLPIPFSDSFEYKEKVERYLTRNVPGYRTVSVRLKNDDTAFDEEITRSFPDNLQAPRFLEASWPMPPQTPVPRAFIWACMSKRNSLKPNGGIYFKKRGFTLGDGTELREKFSKRPAVYDWYAGEVYVVDETVIPNAARNGFEKNTGYRNLWSALDAPAVILLKEADDYSKRNRATEVISDVETAFREMIGAVDERSAYAQAVSALEAIQRMYVKLEGQKIPVRDPSFKSLRAKKTFLENLIGQERVRLRDLVERAEPAATEQDGVQSTGAGFAFSALANYQPVGDRRWPSTTALVELFAAQGWPIDEKLRDALLGVGAAMSQVLGDGEPAYRAVIETLRKILGGKAESGS